MVLGPRLGVPRRDGRPGRYHLRLEDFSVRNGALDLYVYLSTAADDYADDSLELGRL